MAAKHTPGPWVVAAEQPTLIRTERGIGIADTFGNTILAQEQAANARLIAAAPLMRKALLAVRAACHDPDTDTALPSAVGKAVEAALTQMGERP